MNKSINPFFCFFTGLFVGVLITTICFYLCLSLGGKNYHDYLTGGWVLSADSDSVDMQAPVSLDFKRDEVTVRTADGTESTCKYRITESEHGVIDEVVIFDYPGIGDVRFSYVAKQPLLHLEGSDTVFDGHYSYAG